MTGRIRKTPLRYTTFTSIYLAFIKLLGSKNNFITKTINARYISLLDKSYIIYPSHVAIPLTKKIMYKLENKYNDEFIITGESKFRSPSDLRITYLAANFSNYVSIYGKDKNFMTSISYKKINVLKDQYLICINLDASINSQLQLRKFFQERHNIVY